MRTIVARLLGACALLAFGIAAANAQSYPSRNITLIVPFAAGGPADVLARLVGQKLSEELGQQVIIDNRGGGNTIIGAQMVAKAKPDGYTLLMAIDGTMVMNPYLYSKLAYDPFKDFEPISLIALVPSVLEANLNAPVNSVKDIIDQEKAKPGKFMVGVSTPTSQVIAALFNSMAGINITQVPYKGGMTQVTSLMSGDIPLGFESANVALPLWRSGKLKILAVTEGRRLSVAPEIPTVGETLPGFDLGIWQSIVAPAGTPHDIIKTLHASIHKTLTDPEVREKLLKIGLEPKASASPDEFAAFLKSQAQTRSKLIQAVGMKFD